MQERSEMTFVEHLEELRRRLIISLVAVVVAAIPCGIFWRRLFELLMIYPLRFSDPKPRLVFTAPAEAIAVSIKLAIAGGIILATPVIFYQLWKFISPGLYKKEKAIILPSVVASTFCFLLGVGFAYMTLPHILRFLSGFGAGTLEPFFKADEYIGFLAKIALAFGVCFELPVLSFILTKMGVLSPKYLINKIRYALVLIFIVAAVLTPPDIISQTVLAVPLVVLYAISILVSFLARPKDTTDQPAAG